MNKQFDRQHCGPKDLLPAGDQCVTSGWHQTEFAAPEGYFSALEFPTDTEWLLSSNEQPSWSHSRIAFAEATFWKCTTSSGHVISGSSYPHAWRIGVDLSGAPSLRANGGVIPGNGAYAIAPSDKYCFACCGPHEVCKIVVPEATLQDIPPQSLIRQSGVYELTTRVKQRLGEFLNSEHNSAPVPSADEAKALVRDIMQCLGPSDTARRHQRQDRTELFMAARNAIRETPAMNPTIAALADACDVSERTIRTVFRDYTGLSPQEYIRLNRLHESRRRLTRPTSERLVIKEVAAALGFRDFGRFAGYYHAAFLELPSETLRRINQS